MVHWRVENETDTAWDERLRSARDAVVFQSSGWARFKTHAGWRPFRAAARDDRGRLAAMIQFLIRRMPLGIAMAWAPGGPVWRFDESTGGMREDDWPGLFALLKSQFPWVLARVDSYEPEEARETSPFGALFHRPRMRIGSGASIRFDIAEGEGAFVKGMSSKHRYYLRKGLAAPLRWEAGSSDRDIAALASLHREMQTSKNLQAGAVTEASCRAMRDALGSDGMTIVTGYVDDWPVTSCLTLDFADSAFYYVAATGAEGRKLSAAYAMLPRLVAVLHAKGVRRLDFGGIAPDVPARAGVDHFKKGFGGETVTYRGEWEAASLPLLAPAAGLLMKWRGVTM